MKKPLAAAMIVILLVGGCQSRYNPVNWFGRSKEVTTLEPEKGYAAVAVDNRPLVDQITTMTVERAPGGALVRATGLPPTQGFWNAELVAQNGGKPVDGVLTFRFVATPPRTPEPQGTQASREINVAAFVSDYDLGGVRQITVQGARNQHTSRR